MKRILTSPFGLLCCVVLMMTSNGLSTALPLNGLTPKQISDLYPLLITPKSWAFSIWGVIYSGVLGFTLFQFQSSFREKSWFEEVSLPFALSCLFNAAWLPLWHYRFEVLSTLVIIALLVSLFFVYLPLHKVAEQDWKTRWTRGTFSIYSAWVTIATILNVSFALYGAKWSGWGIPAVVWGCIMLCVALGLFLVIVYPRKDWVFAGVLVWASAAIYAKSTVQVIQATAIVVISVLVVTMLLLMFQRWKSA